MTIDRSKINTMEKLMKARELVQKAQSKGRVLSNDEITALVNGMNDGGETRRTESPLVEKGK